MNTYVKRRHRRIRLSLLLLALLLTGMGLLVIFRPKTVQEPPGMAPESQQTLEAFASDHGLRPEDWPEELLTLYSRNPETEDFVLHYPLNRNEQPEIDLSPLLNSDTVPLLMQWDERWGYTEYAGGLLGLTGCGPTCLSMVCLYLLDNPDLDPKAVAAFSAENGYSVAGNGSTWTLISEGGRKLGLDVVEIPLDKQRIIRNLEVGNPIICIMGPGDFTSEGHFIVLTGYQDGKLRVNDPNSRKRSESLWDYDSIQGQIRNLWVCRS